MRACVYAQVAITACMPYNMCVCVYVRLSNCNGMHVFVIINFAFVDSILDLHDFRLSVRHCL